MNKDQPRIPKGFVGAGRFMKVGQVLVAVAKDAARPGDGGGRKPRGSRLAKAGEKLRPADGKAAAHPPTPDGVRAAYMDLVREQGRDNPDDAPYVSLADLRERLGGTREEQDAALREIEQHGDTNIVPQANQKVTSDRTRSGAVRIGGQDKSHIAIGPNIGEPGPVDVAARRRESAASRKADAEARAAASAKTAADREARYSTPQAQTQIRADAAEIRAEHPDWSDAQVRAELERDYPAGAVGKAIQAKPSAAPSRRAAATADAAAEIAKLRSELDYVESSRDTHGDRGRDPNSVARRGRNAAAAAIRQRIADLEAGTASPALPDAEVDARIARAYADLARPGQHLSLVRLRNRLQDIDRPTLDRALKRLDRARVIQLDAEPNQKGLPLAARDASIRQGGEDRHLITSRELHGRASTSPAPAAQPARTAKPTKARLASVGAKLTPAAPPPTPLGGQLQKAASREQAHQLIAPLTVVELRDLAKELGVPVRSGANKTALRNAIVQLAVGVRLDSKAINPG